MELGEDIFACLPCEQGGSSRGRGALQSGKADLSSLTSMLQARWKGSAPAP